MNDTPLSVAQFNITYTQMLDEHGTLLTPLPDFVETPEQLVPLYETMVHTRVFDTKAIALQRTGRLGTYPSSLGQEAIYVAIGHALHPNDVFLGYYRDFGTHLQRGVKMEELFLFWGGDERGSHFESCPEDFPPCIPIASQCLHAAGVGAAMKIRNQSRCTLVTVGDGGTSEGDFYEALNVAGAWNLPIVFVINNNQWAISVPLSEQTATQTLAQKAIAAGIPGEQVDGNDIIATRHVISKAIEKARSGQGPSVIEALTYRLSDHTTVDDANRYRPKDELNAALAKEPIKRLRRYLESCQVWSDQQEQALQQRCSVDVEQAVERYMAYPKPTPDMMFDYLFAQLTEPLKTQRLEAMRIGDTLNDE